MNNMNNMNNAMNDATVAPATFGVWLSSVCGYRAEIDFDLQQVKEFPVNMAGETLFQKVAAAVGEEEARGYCFSAWTNLAARDPRRVGIDGGRYDSPGAFLGYVRGREVKPSGLTCVWGNSDLPSAELEVAPEYKHDVILAINHLDEGEYISAVVYGGDHLRMAKALGVEPEALFIKAP